MVTLTTYIKEALAYKKELTEFEQAWVDWLNSHGKEGHLSSNVNVKDELIKFVRKSCWDNVEYQEERADYHWVSELVNLIWKNKGLVKIEEIKSKNALSKFLSKYFDENYFEDFVNEYATDKEKFNDVYTRYMINQYFVNFEKESKTYSNGLLKIVRSVSIPKTAFKNKSFDSYRDWIDAYFEGLGIYWSFSQGGVYCFQSFDDDKMIDNGNSVTLDIYGLCPLSSIDKGGTFRQLQSGFDSEQEITVISGEPIEVYQVILKDRDGSKYKLPIKKSIICRA